MFFSIHKDGDIVDLVEVRRISPQSKYFRLTLLEFLSRLSWLWLFFNWQP